MQRKPTYAGKIQKKDEQDILFWALNKTPRERLEESWRLHCVNHGVEVDVRLNKNIMRAHKRDV